MQEQVQNQETGEATGSQAPGAAVADEQKETTPGMEELLRRAELKAQEHYDAYLRAKAEADNLRKRAQVDVQNAHKFGIESFANALLPVKDSLEAALAAQNNTVETLRGGVELTLKQLGTAFEKFSLTEINPAGQKFDPHRHQAMTLVDADAEPNTVVQVLQKGYALYERVLRPALVCVAKGKDANG